MTKISVTRIFQIAILLLVGQTTFGQTAEDTTSVIKIVNGVTIYFYEQKMDLFADLWDKNATFITVTGLKAKGRDAIVDLHSMGKYLIDSSTVTKLDSPIINFINKDLAIAYSIWGGLVFKQNGRKMPTQSGYLTIVLQRQKAGWKVLSATNAFNFMGGKNFKFEEYSHDKTWTEFGLGDKK